MNRLSYIRMSLRPNQRLAWQRCFSSACVLREQGRAQGNQNEESEDQERRASEGRGYGDPDAETEYYEQQLKSRSGGSQDQGSVGGRVETNFRAKTAPKEDENSLNKDSGQFVSGYDADAEGMAKENEQGDTSLTEDQPGAKRTVDQFGFEGQKSTDNRNQ